MKKKDCIEAWVGYEFSHALINGDHVILKRGGHVTAHWSEEMGHVPDISTATWRIYAHMPGADYDDVYKTIRALNATMHCRKEETDAS